VDWNSLLDGLQWPAMAITLVAAFLVGARHARKRILGFYTFILSNALWVVWGVHDGAWALIALQTGLFAMNVRGIVRNEKNPV
jgi:TctA family transporter